MYISGKIKLKYYKWIWNSRKFLKGGIIKKKIALIKIFSCCKGRLINFCCVICQHFKRLTNMTSFVLYCLLQSPCVDCLFSGGSLLLRWLIRRKVIYRGATASPKECCMLPRHPELKSICFFCSQIFLPAFVWKLICLFSWSTYS